ncbi:MAG: outer membrane protein assembly factor BamB [Verrucomicrobiales bacterium]|jgi:outer membrane protein assembly factor BamB
MALRRKRHDDGFTVRLPNAKVAPGPERRRRRRRSVDRVRIGLVLGLVFVAGTALFALPVAEDIRTTTFEFLSIADSGDADAASSTDEQPQDEVLVTELEERVEPGIEFDRSVFVDPQMVGVAPPTVIEGLLTFRGSPTRSYYGRGPVPDDPEVVWQYPETGGLCRESSVGGQLRAWCGTGWTGQPTLFRLDGRLWSIFGALDGAVHFLDAETGKPLLPKFQTNDIIKGSVTVDPDGFPLVYSGSRDNLYRVIAYDNGAPRELWSLDAEATSPTKWNNDWDGAGLVIDDYLFVGGENSRIHIAKLNRGWGDDGLVTVDPELIFSAPGWDDELIQAVGENVSIENSVAISGDTLYFANSGGLVQGWDLSELRNGEEPTRTFRFWAGDDVDASIVIDAEGMLYVAAEYERGTERSRELGQLMKLDPTEPPEDAVVWSVQENQGLNTGIWGTPALHDGAVIFGSQGGAFRAVDQMTGEDLWSMDLRFHLWQSPVVVDDVLLMGDCFGTLHAFDASTIRELPQELWALKLDDSCIESTPAVWDGMIVVGTRSGRVYGIRQK